MTQEQQRIFSEQAYSRMIRGAKHEAEMPVRESAKWHMRHRPYSKDQDVTRRHEATK